MSISSLLLLTACVSSLEHSRATDEMGVLALVPQGSGTDASLRGVCAVSSELAWASGAAGTFVMTRDGGKTWRGGQVPGAEELDFRDVHAFGADRALLLSAGVPARIYATEDGGVNWRLVYRNGDPGVFFDSFAFEGEFGVGFSDPIEGAFLIIVTEDAGRSWREVPRERLPRPLEGEAGFAASGTCVCVREGQIWIGTGGTVARVLHSGDRGRSWSVVPTPLLQGAASAGIFSVAFRDARHGVLVGGDYLKPDLGRDNACVTQDGGMSWRVSTRPPRGYRSAVAWIPKMASSLVAVGTSGSDLSVDGGRSWRALGEVGYHALAFAVDGSGWAVGAGGRIARFTFRQ